MKRLFTRCMLVMMLMIMGIATATAQKSVLDESFENGKPAGWTAGDYWEFGNGYAQFAAPFADGADTLFTPMLDISELDNQPSVVIAYSLVANSGKVNELKVLYRSSEAAAWSEWKTFDAATEGEESVKDVLPGSMTNVQIAIAGSYKLGDETRVLRLAVENKTEATKAPTGLKTEDLTTNSVTLWWDVCESPMFQQYNVKVSTSQLTDMSAEGDVINYVNVAYTDEFLEMSELTPNTEYWLYVQYDCGDGDVSTWAEMSFRTLCEAISGTFAEDFEGAISTCYTIIKGSTAAEVSGEYAYNSQKSFKSYSGKGKYNYFILPEFNGDVKNFQVSFMAAAVDAGNTYARTVTVGVCTDATAESFTEVKTLDLPKGRTWEEIVVTLKAYAGAGKYIAFRFGNEDKENRIFMDNIHIQTAEACPKPMFLQVSEINPNSAKLAWVETGNASEWNLVLSTKPLADPEDIEPDATKGEFAGSISANPYTATNLQPNTTYYAYLQAGCGSSQWTNAVEFKTARPVTYPYAEHFDRMAPDLYTDDIAAIPEGWVFDDRVNGETTSQYYDRQYVSTSTTSYRPYVTTVQNHEATAYVKASLLLRGTATGTASSMKDNTSIAIAPAMPKAVNTMMVTFWAYSSAAQTVKIGVANTQTNDLPQGQQLGANITEVGEAAITGGSEWKQYKVLLTGYTGTGRYIAFYLKPGTSTPSVYIDDIEIDDAPDCNAVSTLTAEATGIDKATATWTDASSSASWTIKVSSTEIDPASADGDIVAAQTVNAKSYNITGLTMGATYYIYVSPTCGDMWKSTSVTTLVGLQVPYYNDFTNENTGANANRGPKNWKLGYTYTDSPSASSSYWPYINTTVWTNAPAGVEKNSLYLYNGTSASYQYPYAIMPELLNANVKDLKISFYLYTTLTANLGTAADPYYDELKIGVVNSPSDINKTDKFTKVTEVAVVRAKASKVAQMEVLDLAAYTGTGKYIVFYQSMESPNNNKANHSYIDNLSITLASAPQPVSNVVASDMTLNSAKLTWKENGKATKWEVRVFDAPQEDPAAGEPVFSSEVTAKEANVTNLSHSTQYYAYVRSVQDNGNGAWGNTSFWTECDKVSLPYVQDFNSFEHGSSSLNTLTPCFMVGDNYGGTSPYYYNYVKNGQATTSSSSATGPGTSYYYIDHTYGNDPATNTFYMYAPKDKYALLVLPEIDGDLATMTMRFYGCYSSAFAAGSSSGGAVEIAIMNADGTFTHVENFKLSKAKDWEEFNLNFPSDIHSGRIAFRINNTAAWRTELGSTYSSGATFYMYIDDIKVQQIPQCQKVLDIEVSNVDSVSAKISWAESEASAWNLKVSSVELADPDAATADVFDGAIETTPSKLIDNLADNTVHYVYVQTVRPEKSCVGEWSQAKVFKTLCRKQNFPYVEDFQSYTTTGAGNLPDCSTICGQDADHSYISTKGTGNYALYLRQVDKEHSNYFAFPALNVDSVKRLQLSMQVYTGSTTATYTYRFEVGVMTDPNDPSTFVTTHHEELAGASTAYDRVYTFEGYAGDDKGRFGTYIALKPLSYKNATGTEYSGTMYMDNISIDYIETCVAPFDLKADSLGTYGAKLNWTTDDKTAAHRVRIYTDAEATPDSEDFVLEKVVNDSVTVIEGLNSLTSYYAYVRKECAENDMSKWSSVLSFITECAPVQTLPYADGFENYDTQTVPSCWTALDHGTNAKCRVYANSSSITYASTGTKGLYINYASVGSSSGYSYYSSSIVTPPLDVENLNELLVCFDYTSISKAGGSLKIEAVSDDTPNAQAIFITQINDMPYSEWKKAYILLKDYYSSVQPYNRLRFTPMSQGISVAIDELLITKDLNTILPVEDVKVKMLTENSIKFSFVEYTPSVNQWQVAYVAADGDIADATVKTIDETEYTIEGLAANTSYDIYVRGNVEGDAWVGPLTATTLQTPATLPYSTGFEDDADKWVIYKVKTVQGDPYPNFFIVGSAEECLGTGDKALFITNDSASYAYQTKDDKGEIGFSYAWAIRNIKVDAAGTYKFKFKVKVPGNKGPDADHQDNDYATAHLFPAGATINAGTATMLDGTTRAGAAVTDVPTSNIYSLMDKMYQKDEWIWVNKTLDVEEAGVYSIAVFWYNASVGAQYGQAIAVDSVIAEEYLCTTPKNIEYTNRAANEVSLKWFGGKCKNFEYVLSRYAKLGNPSLIDAEDKVAYGTLTDGPAITLSNLMPQTKYSFYVRTICEDGTTDWVEYDFLTPCGKYDLPYTEGFFEDAPECWTLSGASAGKTSVGTSAEHEDWRRLLINKGGYAILPEFNVDIKNIEIEIGLFNTTANYGAVSLGVMDNTYDLDSYKEVAFFQTATKPGSTGTYTPTQLEVFNKMMNLYQGTGKVLAIKNATDYTIGVKYVTLTELPDCVKPQQIELTLVTENAVTVNWIGGVEEAWEIQLNDSIIKNVTENPYRIYGLEQGTVYEVSVRALCDAEHTSEWSIPVKFQTECGVYTLPLFEDFSSLQAENQRAMLTCWSNMATDYPIEQVFNGTTSPYEPASNVYYTYMWIANYLEKLGDEHQLLFFGSTILNSGPKYRWMITPQYAIEGKASVSFDVKHVDNQNNAAKPEGRFIVAISTDNGATWKKDDATVIEGIDSVYTTKSVSLDKYAGKNIRVAFYMENLGGTTTSGKGSGIFTLLDNIRMNCTEEYPVADNACQGYDYEGYGFSIKAEELPVAGQDSTYYRFAAAEGNGCDSTIALTITTRVAAEPKTLYETICEGDYYKFGGQKLTKPNPEGIPYQLLGETVYGCDSLVYLYLTVQQNDTATFNVTAENSELPKEVDAFYTIPADAPIGLPFDTLIRLDGCAYNRYFVTVNRCTDSVGYADQVCEGARYEGYGFVIEAAELPAAGESKLFSHIDRTALGCDSMTTLTLTVMSIKQTILTDNICESEATYEGYDFVIDKADWPAAGESKDFFKYLTSVQGCDSIVKLTLTVLENDTTDIPVTKFNNELPYTVDDLYTIPAGTEVGSFEVVLPNGNKCGYNRYLVTIEQCTQQEDEADTNCEGKDYQGYGFEIPVADQPAAGYTKDYYRDEMIEGCKVTTKLTLTVVENDTTTIPVVINADKLPYYVDAIYTVPAESQVGSFVEILPNGEDCGYNRYEVTINDVGTGLINLSDEVDHIEVFDALGRRVRTLRHGDEQYNLPAGVYMLHTVMKSGKAENRKVTLK